MFEEAPKDQGVYMTPTEGMVLGVSQNISAIEGWLSRVRTVGKRLNADNLARSRRASN